MKVHEIPVERLKEYEHNARKNDKAVDLVADSIKRFGFTVPIVIDKNDVIVAGHTRLKAAKRLGMKTLPAVIADDLTDEQIKAFRLADNKTAEIAEWDFERLEEELNEINEDWLFSLFEKKRYEDIEVFDGEISLEDFGDEQFKYECPECGFHFNA